MLTQCYLTCYLNWSGRDNLHHFHYSCDLEKVYSIRIVWLRNCFPNLLDSVEIDISNEVLQKKSAPSMVTLVLLPSISLSWKFVLNLAQLKDIGLRIECETQGEINRPERWSVYRYTSLICNRT